MTLLCKPLEDLSKRLWHYLTDVFAYSLHAAEIGITNHLVYFITSFYGGRSAGVEVYAFNAQQEKHRGADIDLFIELPNGKYRHYMLQAKVSSETGTFKDIEHWHKGAQYNKLLDRARSEGATAYYLLYSGSARFSSFGSASYGFSCVHANEIKSLKRAFYLSKPGSAPTITFNLLWRRGRMFPFHRLFCITPSRFFHSKRMEHEGKDIYRGYPYRRIEPTLDTATQDDNSSIENEKGPDLNSDTSLAPYRVIVNRLI
jgi:hypothetical protein